MCALRRRFRLLALISTLAWFGSGTLLACDHGGGMQAGFGGFDKMGGGAGFKAQARFEKGMQARAAGNIKLASQHFLRAALAHPQNQYSFAARQALVELAAEGRQQLAALQRSSGDRTATLKQLNRLAANYENVPLMSREIGAARRQFRKQWSPALGSPNQLLAASSRGRAVRNVVRN